MGITLNINIFNIQLTTPRDLSSYATTVISSQDNELISQTIKFKKSH